MDRTENYILNRLDQPLRFLGVNKDEACALMGPLLASMYLGWILSGIVVGVLVLLALRALKKRNEGAALVHAIYWYLPVSRKSMKLPVLSHIREYIG
jgi:type IV conjugative transfer system protein TraL